MSVSPTAKVAHSEGETRPATILELPPGTPKWITPELVELTIRVWQPGYAETISIAEAIGMIQIAGRLFDALKE